MSRVFVRKSSMKESAGGASDMTDDALIDAAKLQADLERSWPLTPTCSSSTSRVTS